MSIRLCNAQEWACGKTRRRFVKELQFLVESEEVVYSTPGRYMGGFSLLFSGGPGHSHKLKIIIAQSRILRLFPNKILGEGLRMVRIISKGSSRFNPHRLPDEPYFAFPDGRTQERFFLDWLGEHIDVIIDDYLQEMNPDRRRYRSLREVVL